MTFIYMNWEDMTLVATGHAGGGVYGEDIICAGVSSLLCALVNTLEDARKRGRIKLDLKLDEEHGGDMRIHVEPALGFVGDINAYFKVIMVGLKGIADKYPENVKVGEVWTSGNL